MPSPRSTWISESCRVSLFSTEVIDPVDTVFEAIAGTLPANSAIDRQTNQSSAAGPWKTGSIQVSAYPGRIDFVYGPTVPALSGLVHLEGSSKERFQDLVGAVSAWIPKQRYKFNRAAVGGRCMQSAESVDEAYSLLGSYVKPLTVDYPRIREVMYRGNIPINSKSVPDLSLNRISTWNVLTFHSGLFNSFTGNSTAMSATYFCVCEVDFNTAAERAEVFPTEGLVLALNELQEEVMEVLATGVR